MSLQTRDVFSDDPDVCDDADARTHYVGMLLSQGGSGGRAYRDYDQAWFVLSESDGGAVDGVLINKPWGGRTLAHELGHNYDRAHVDCGNPDEPDGNYPYPPCQFSAANPGNPGAEMYGFDIVTEKYIPSTAAAGDLMSYADPRWISDYTWNAIYNQLQNQDFFGEGSEREVNGGEVMLVTAVIYPDSNTGTLAYLIRHADDLIPANKLADLLDAQQGSDYVLRLVDGGGATLSERTFSPVHIDDSAQTTLLVTFAIPYQDGTAQVQLRQGGNILDSRVASDNPPTVQLLSPNGGQTIGSSLTVTWTAVDADDDWLLYTLQYSRDNGQSWQVIANDLYTTTYTIADTAAMAGSDGQALIRVVANDGLHTAYDQSDTTFTMPLHAPQVFIHNETEFFTDTIELIGSAVDAEDVLLTGAALRWSVDALGVVGAGETAVLADMPPGSYEVTLTATDSDGMTGTATVTIVVRERDNTIYLPFVTR